MIKNSLNGNYINTVNNYLYKEIKIMVKLKPLEFRCPFCGHDRVTFITEEKFNELVAREKNMQDIFNPEYFASTYREILISKLCSECQAETFMSPESKKNPFDADIDADTTALEARISEMYENAERA